MKKFFALAILFLITINTLQADILRCRSGIIVGAELSTANIQIANLSTLGFPQLPVNRCYAVVSIKPDDLRVFSIFDYSLLVAGVEFPCVAVLRNGKFEYFTGNVSTTGIQQLLFILDAKVVSGSKDIDITLKSKLNDPAGKFDTVVPFSIIGSRQPTAPNKIPSDGLLELPGK